METLPTTTAFSLRLAEGVVGAKDAAAGKWSEERLSNEHGEETAASAA